MDNEIYPLFYPTSPTPLQDFALTESALLFCRLKRFTPIDILKLTDAECFSCCEEVFGKLSNSFKAILTARIRSIGAELKALFHYLYEKEQTGVFYGNGEYGDIFFKCFDCFKYGPDGTICWERSARNLLSNDQLSQLEKYKIACEYCFEDDVRKLWPAVCGDPQVNSPNFVIEPVLDFWARRMKNDKRVPPTHRYVMNGFNRLSGNWAVFKYMLNRNSVEDQLKDIDEMFEGKFYGRIECFLPKLNSVQVDRLLKEYPNQVIYELAWKAKYSEYLFRIWSLVKESITDEQFYKLLSDLCCDAFRCVSSCDDRELGFRFGDMMRLPRGIILPKHLKPNCAKLSKPGDLPYEIWICSPDELKKRFVRNNAANLFADLNRYERWNIVRCYDHDMQFFLQLFTDMPFELREATWRKYWPVIVSRSRPNRLNNFLKICLRNEDIRGFVETEMMNYTNVENFVEFLLEKHHYADVIDYANLCSSNQPLAREFRRRALLSSNRLMRFINEAEFDTVIELNKFIDGSFADADELRTFKEAVFLSDDFQGLLIKFLRRGCTDEVIQLTGIFRPAANN